MIKKTLNKLGKEGNFLDLKKGTYENPQLTSYLTVKTASFPSKIGNKMKMFSLANSIRHCPGGSSQSN